MAREALLISGWPTPTPAQNSLKPPPVPVDSTTGVLKLPVLPNCSATAVENGNTVLEPTMRIWSRASAAEAAKASEAGSEEQRVGKEGVRKCRYRWAPLHYKNKEQNIHGHIVMLK